MNNFKNYNVDKNAKMRNYKIENNKKSKEDYSVEIDCLLKDQKIEYQLIEKKFVEKYSQYTIVCDKKFYKCVIDLANDFAMATQSNHCVRAYIQNGNVIVEVPNKIQADISLFDATKKYRVPNKQSIEWFLGEDINGNKVVTNFEKTPHLLIGGSIGSGKSNFIKSIISQIILNNKSNEVKFLLIDPKNMEYKQFKNLPYVLYNEVFSTNLDVQFALQKMKEKIEKRYTLFCDKRVLNIEKYNKKSKIQKLPKIVIVVDEFADYMFDIKQQFEDYVEYITKKGRACGIYLILATQRITDSTITNKIKRCFYNILTFNLCAEEDSLLLIDSPDAKYLSDNGDALFKDEQKNLNRLTTYYVTDEEIQNVINSIKKTN